MNLRAPTIPPFTQFIPSERVICVKGDHGRLIRNRAYTVVDVADLGPPTKLIELAEVPGILFHPSRFKAAPR